MSQAFLGWAGRGRQRGRTVGHRVVTGPRGCTKGVGCGCGLRTTFLPTPSDHLIDPPPQRCSQVKGKSSMSPTWVGGCRGPRTLATHCLPRYVRRGLAGNLIRWDQCWHHPPCAMAPARERPACVSATQLLGAHPWGRPQPQVLPSELWPGPGVALWFLGTLVGGTPDSLESHVALAGPLCP